MCLHHRYRLHIHRPILDCFQIQRGAAKNELSFRRLKQLNNHVIWAVSFYVKPTLINISLVDPTWVFVVLSISKIISIPVPSLICTRNEQSAPSKSKFLV